MINSIVFPDTLVNMWNFANRQNSNNFSEDLYFISWNIIIKFLASHFVKNQLPGIDDYTVAEDEAKCFFIDLLQGSCPVHIRSYTNLIANARKYLARKNNPVQYELNSILHLAITDLEKLHRIERDAQSKNKNISKFTLLAIINTPENCKGTFQNYEKNKASIPNYSTKIRGGSVEHSKILSPSDARELVLQLLQAFGGWTKKTDLFTAMQNHVPEQFKIVSLTPLEEEDENLLENLGGVEDEYENDFEKIQVLRIASLTAERIWKRICSISNKVFCLYYLPKTISTVTEVKVDIKMDTLGKTSTVSDQNRKIATIVQDEMGTYMEDNEGYKSKSIKRTVVKILNVLGGNCTQCGYKPGIFSKEINC